MQEEEKKKYTNKNQNKHTANQTSEQNLLTLVTTSSFKHRWSIFFTLFFSFLSLRHKKQPNFFPFLSLSSNLQTLFYLFAHSLLKNAFFFFFYDYFFLLIVMHFIRNLILTTCHKIEINFIDLYWLHFEYNTRKKN